MPAMSGIWRMFRTIVAQPNAALALHAMQETGILSMILPAWQSIDCLVVRDFYHGYTVDEHTLVAIGHIDALRTGTDAARRRFSEMLAETPDAALIITALLFHDVGKSVGFEDHAKASAREAVENLSKIGTPPDELNTIAFLIERHLDLSAAMNSRDLNDPGTAAELAANVETLEKLRALTLLTYADISAVNPDAMTPWRLEQLWHAYLAAHRELTKELDTGRIHSTVTDIKSQWLEGFPVRWVRTHSAAQITLTCTSRMQPAAKALRSTSCTGREHGI